MIQKKVDNEMVCFDKEISVVLGTYNRLRFLKLAIKSIRQELVDFNKKAEIIVIDGGSTDGTIGWLTKQKDIISIIQHNRGVWNGEPIVRRSWGYFMNLGFKTAQGKYVCMLSDDCLLIPGSLKNGYVFFERKVRAGEKLGSVAFYFRDWPFSKNYHVNINFGKLYLNHGFYLKKALDDVGYANENDYRFYGADIDLGMKMFDKGYVCLVADNSYVEHFADANNLVRNTNISVAKNDSETLQKKWSKKYGKMGGEWKTKIYVDDHSVADSFKLPLALEYWNQFCHYPWVFCKRLFYFFKKWF